MSRLVMSRKAWQVLEFLLVSAARSVGKYLIAYGASGQRATLRVKGYRSNYLAVVRINRGLGPVTPKTAEFGPSAFGYRPIVSGQPAADGRSPRGDGAGGRITGARSCGPTSVHSLTWLSVKCRLGGDRQLERSAQDVAAIEAK